MDKHKFVAECTAGGPGLVGYAYQADTYCIACGKEIVSEIASRVAPTIEGLDDPMFYDSETVPQPIFFGEGDDYCGRCGERLGE